jgi:MYXO-CTERM domain-containing protein
MQLSNTKVMTGLRAAAIGLMFGAFLSGPISAQDSQPVTLAQETAQPAQDDGGFDDWGLLGLLGLAGLAGLRRPKSVVHEDLRNTSGR